MELAQMFAEVSRTLLDQRDVQSTLNRIVQLAQANLKNAESVGVTIIKGRKIESPASSGELALLVDRLQELTDQGPCLDALRNHEVVLISDLESDTRWPEFARRAHNEAGVSSIMSLRLFVHEDTIGSLNVYSTQRDAFDDKGLALGAIFATHAAVAIARSRREANLELKADSRDLIGRAKGILMAQRHVTDEQAFALLREASQRLNVKLVKIADDVTFTGDLPRPVA